MAVGAIPILQYNKMFYPHLAHLDNCLAYESFDTLDAAIETALNMTAEEIQQMKQQVMKF